MRRHSLDLFEHELAPPAQRYYRAQASTNAAITADDAKSHLRVDGDDDDDAILRAVAGAIQHMEGSGADRDGVLGKALLTQTWKLEAERPDCGMIRIEFGPVQSITTVEVMSNGSYATWAPANYRLGFRNGEAFVTPVQGQSFPDYDCREDAFRITYVCGYGDTADKLPANLINALLLHVGHLFENRDAVVLDARGQAITTPQGYETLIDLHRFIPLP